MRVLVLAAFALTGCGGAEDDGNVTVPLESATPALPPASVDPAIEVGRDAVMTEQMDVPEIAGLPRTPGQWLVRREPAGDAALYGDPAVGAVLSIRCDEAARTITIRAVGAAGPGITVRTDRGSNLFEAVADGKRAAIARFPSHYPWFADALATASGMMLVQVESGPPLIVPAGNPMAQVVKDCPK